MNGECGVFKLFCGENCYPLGGYEDFKEYFQTIEEAQEYTKEKYRYGFSVWAQIVSKDRIIMNGKKGPFINDPWEWEDVTQ